MRARSQAQAALQSQSRSQARARRQSGTRAEMAAQSRMRAQQGTPARVETRALAAVLVVALMVAVSAPAHGSLASIGYSVLRWLDRAQIVHHDLVVEVDPPRFQARFVDDVTLISSGSRQIHVLFGNDVSLLSVRDSEGQAVPFSPSLSWGALPFTIYRVQAPAPPKGESFRLRFEWEMTPESIRQFNPFVALRFFYVGYASLWYPNMPGEEFFEADITVIAPQGYTAIADGELLSVDALPDGRERHRFRTPEPVHALGVGAGMFRPLEPVRAGEVVVQGWRPVGWQSSVERVVQYAAGAIRFYSERLGALSFDRFTVAEFPFPWPTSYPSFYQLAYGGDLTLLGLEGERGLAYLAAHETAHRWINGVAGVRIVSSHWLSEGLAEYLGYLALEELIGKEEALKLFLERTYEPFVERMQKRHRSLAAVELMDDDYQLIYEKGALVFRMLHRRLGEDAFYGLIRRWVDEYRGDFSTGDDFIRLAVSFAETVEGTNAREIRSFLEQWVKGTHTLDYALDVLEAGERQLRARIVSRGRLVEPGPVPLHIELEDGRIHVVEMALNQEIDLTLPARPVAATLDPEMWLADANPDNNRWHAEGR